MTTTLTLLGLILLFAAGRTGRLGAFWDALIGSRSLHGS